MDALSLIIDSCRFFRRTLNDPPNLKTIRCYCEYELALPMNLKQKLKQRGYDIEVRRVLRNSQGFALASVGINQRNRKSKLSQGLKILISDPHPVGFDFSTITEIAFSLGGQNLRLHIDDGWKHGKADVCLVSGWSLNFPNLIDVVNRQVSYCKEKFPAAPIIMFGSTAHWKYNMAVQKLVAHTQYKPINRKRGDKLARDVGAVKYVECSHETGRGYKILFDEIAFAYFSKLKDEEEKHKEDRIHQRKAELEKQRHDKVCNFFLFFVLPLTIFYICNRF